MPLATRRCDVQPALVVGSECQFDSRNDPKSVIQPSEVVLHRLARGMNDGRDLLVRLSIQDKADDLALSIRELDIAGLAVTDLIVGECRPARGNGSDGLDQLVERRRLDEKAIRPESKGRGNVLATSERRQDQDGRPPPSRRLGKQLESVSIRKADVQQQDIHVATEDRFSGRRECPTARDNLEIRDCREGRFQAAQDDRMIVNEADTDYARHETATRVPERPPSMDNSAPMP